MLGTLQEPTTFGFVVFFITFGVIVYAATGNRRAFFWLLMILAFLGLVFWSVVLPITMVGFSYLVANPLSAGLLLSAYVASGIVVAILKWRTYSKEVVEEAGRFHISFHPKDENGRLKAKYKAIPEASKNKSTIAGWIGWWPLWAVDFMFTKMLRGFFRTIAEKTQHLFNNISRSRNKDVIEAYERLLVEEEQGNKKL